MSLFYVSDGGKMTALFMNSSMLHPASHSTPPSTSAPHAPAVTPPAPAEKYVRPAAFVLIVGFLAVWGTPPLALAAGMIFALVAGAPFPHHGAKFAKKLLQVCVVLLGFSMNLPVILQAGYRGAAFAAATIGTTLALGYWLGRKLAVEPQTARLIAAGTAICGGSAIAAVGSVIAATEAEIAVALGIVFLLNAAALYLFPLVGHALHLTQHQFGVWAGVGIHDISSVVGAAFSYGPQALETATAVKLSRSLWIIPLTLAMAYLAGTKTRKHHDAEKPQTHHRRWSPKHVPWFIGFFLLASLLRSLVPPVAGWSPEITQISRWGLTLVLGLIGATLTPRLLRTVGRQAALHAIVLWVFISTLSLLMAVFWA